MIHIHATSEMGTRSTFIVNDLLLMMMEFVVSIGTSQASPGQPSPQQTTARPHTPPSAGKEHLKYQPNPGGDTLSDFVTLVCDQENRGRPQHGLRVNNIKVVFPSFISLFSSFD